jgi:uncharacterized membrane protein YidH (DUF202 family)
MSYLVIIGVIVIVVCMNRRKANLKTMERKIQMDLDTTKDIELKSQRNNK